MKVQLIYYRSWDYVPSKTGKRSQGKKLGIITSDPINKDDGQGNFTFGHTFEEVNFPLFFPLDDSEVASMIGHNVDIVIERLPGQRDYTVVDLKLIEEDE